MSDNAQHLAGEGVRVALIDSGVDGTHPWLEGARLTHLRVAIRSNAFAVVGDDGGDRSGHGTACAGIIHSMVPAAEIVSVGVLGERGRGGRGALIRALRHCVEERYQVVNLSLGIDIPRRAALKLSDHSSILQLYELADAAYTAGVVLVAAGPNVVQKRTYPGRFKALIGVGRGRFADPNRLATSRNQDHEILGPGTDVLAPVLGGGQRRFTGTSFACPFVAAHVARILAAAPGLPIEEVKVALHKLAQTPSAEAAAS